MTLSTSPWSQQWKLEALLRGSHQSAHDHIIFLRQEFVDMIHKGQLIMLPASVFLDDPNLHLSPLSVLHQSDRRRITSSDYTFFFVNEDMMAIAPGGVHAVWPCFMARAQAVEA
jgi:hypothetical protein